MRRVMSTFACGSRLSARLHARDPAHVDAVVDAIKDGGAQAIQVISDFDFTLTRTHVDDLACDSSWGALEHSRFISESYLSEARALKSHYQPIEHEPKMSIEAKFPHMEEWYRKVNALLAKSQVTHDQLDEAAKECKVVMRELTHSVFAKLNEHRVPLLVLSAGLGDMVESILRHHQLMLDNVKVHSNFMVFDQENGGRVSGLREPIIHVFNKNEKAIDHHSGYFKDLSHRPNVILLGDSLGDLNMADGVEGSGALLKIGFLNHMVEEKLEQYKAAFDVVLVDEPSLQFFDTVLDYVLGTN